MIVNTLLYVFASQTYSFTVEFTYGISKILVRVKNPVFGVLKSVFSNPDIIL